MSTETALAPLAEAQRALANASTFEEFKAIRDTAEGLRAYAKARNMGLDAENTAAEYVIRSERGMGQALTRMRSEGELRPVGGDYRTTSTTERSGVTLSELLGQPENVANKHAAMWRALARVPDDTFEHAVAVFKATGKRMSKVNFYRLTEPERKMQKEALAVIREALASDDALPVFADFERATVALVAGMDTLPTDELAKVATLVRGLVAKYTEVRAARGG